MEERTLWFKIAWVRKALENWPKLKEIWIVNVIRTFYNIAWAYQFWSLEKMQRIGCSNKIMAQNI